MLTTVSYLYAHCAGVYKIILRGISIPIKNPQILSKKIPSKLEVAPHALKMWTGWMDGWMGDTP